MANGVHASHGAGQTGGPGMASLSSDPSFQQLLAQSADALGASEGEVMQAMHAAESLVAGRTDLSEDQKLSMMMDFITERFNASDLTDSELMTLMELCRMCLGAWQREAAAEEGYELVQPGMSATTPMAALAQMFGTAPRFMADPSPVSAPGMAPPAPLPIEEERDE